MKYLLLILTIFISTNALAEQEINVSYMRVQQNLFGTIAFSMDAAQIGYANYHSSGLGIRAVIARSLQTGNNSYYQDKFYENKISSLTQIQLAYRYPVTDNFRLIVAYGVTDYKSQWWVNGVEPSWSKGSDSGKGASYGFQYDFATRNLAWEVMAGKPYDKMKEGFGREETYVLSSGITYKF